MSKILDKGLGGMSGSWSKETIYIILIATTTVRLRLSLSVESVPRGNERFEVLLFFRLLKRNFYKEGSGNKMIMP